MIQPKIRYKQLDGLRAIAMLLVLTHHTLAVPVEQHLFGYGLRYIGYLFHYLSGAGLELFFVLSGYFLVWAYGGAKKMNIPKYYFRRLQRLWPPFLVALIYTGIIIGIATLYPTWYSEDMLPKFEFRSFIAHIGMINPLQKLYNPAWWSLQVEILFYLLLPFIFLQLQKISFKLWKYLIIVIFFNVISVIVIPSFYERWNWVVMVFVKFARYSPCFLIGAMVASHNFDASKGKLFMLVGMSYVLITNYFLPANSTTGLSIFWAGLIILIIRSENLRIARLLKMPTVLWIGERSYSFYLTHYATIYYINYFVSHFVESRTMTYFFVTRGLSLPLALIITMFLFHFVERHFARNLSTSYSFWPILSFDDAQKNNLKLKESR